MDDKPIRNDKLNLYGNSPEDIARQVLNTPPPERSRARGGRAKRDDKPSEERPERPPG